ncbi:MAG TPA: tetratricopeptide repeat protein [Acidobacteriaceae bacterium]|nr:tetratricopeptide repeat protein [Acidobacteriaceae bacterium]
MTLRLILAAVFLPAVPVWGQAQGSATMGRGVTLLEQGKPEEARVIFEAILQADPSNAAAQARDVEASERLALEKRANGQDVDALSDLLRAQQRVPANARLEYDLGILEDEMHLYPEAEKALQAAQDLHMENPRLLYAVARVEMDAGQLAAAAEKMQAYLKLQPNDASAHYGLGRIFEIGLQFDKARAEFDESVRLQPEQTEAYYQLGDIDLKQNQYEAALGEFEKTLARNPKHGGALADAGEACFKEKRYDKALDYLQRAIAVAPDYQPGHYYLGLTLARLGRKEDSEKELATAAKLADEDNRKGSARYQLVVPGSQQR